MTDRGNYQLYQLDAFCGQCKGSQGQLVAIGSWSVVFWSRAQFLNVHEMHCPVEIRVTEVKKEAPIA